MLADGFGRLMAHIASLYILKWVFLVVFFLFRKFKIVLVSQGKKEYTYKENLSIMYFMRP